jgi:hypothetical protein
VLLVEKGVVCWCCWGNVLVDGGWVREGRVREREGREFDFGRVCSGVCGRRRVVGFVKRDDGDRLDRDVDVDVKDRVLC